MVQLNNIKQNRIIMGENMNERNLILVINPGSTSTKVAIYDGEKQLSVLDLTHKAEDLKGFNSINDQLGFRKEAVEKYLADKGIKPSDLTAIACRAGVVGELEAGAYEVTEKFRNASLNSDQPHPANLSPIIGYEIAKEANATGGKNVKAYIYDAVCGCGKPNPIYQLTGLPEIERPFLTHVLNSRAVAIEQAKRDGVSIYDHTYIVAHLGGGITVNLICNGKILDFVGDDEGCFSPERTGGIPVRPLVKYCYRSGLDEKQMQKKLKGQGGLMAYLGKNDMRDVYKMIEAGDEKAKICVEAMAMQVAQDIGMMATDVCGKVDKIILTGGIAHQKRFTDDVTERVQFIAPVAVISGTYEMEALAGGVLRVLKGEEKAKVF